MKTTPERETERGVEREKGGSVSSFPSPARNFFFRSLGWLSFERGAKGERQRENERERERERASEEERTEGGKQEEEEERKPKEKKNKAPKAVVDALCLFLAPRFHTFSLLSRRF